MFRCMHVESMCVFIILSLSFATVATAENLSKEQQSIKELLLPKKGENTSEENIKELFSKADDNYSLLPKGDFTASMSVDYSYFEAAQPTAVIVDGRFTILDIVLDSERTLSTSVGLDYGITSNVNVGLSLPYYIKNNEQAGITSHDVGDTQVSVRWQPIPSESGKLTSLLFIAASIPTGQSPYETDLEGESLSTGQGFPSIVIGANFFKVLDPIIGFWSVSYTHNTGADDVLQARTFFLDEESIPGVLTEIDAGDSFSVALGLSYSITYDFTLSMQYQHSITDSSTFTWEYAAEEGTEEEGNLKAVTREGKIKSIPFDSGVAKVTAGWKGENDNYMNLHFTMPMTPGQPDIIIGISFPLK